MNTALLPARFLFSVLAATAAFVVVAAVMEIADGKNHALFAYLFIAFWAFIIIAISSFAVGIPVLIALARLNLSDTYTAVLPVGTAVGGLASFLVSYFVVFIGGEVTYDYAVRVFGVGAIVGLTAGIAWVYSASWVNKAERL